MRRLLPLLLLALAACRTDVPTAGRDVWGRDDGELAVIPLATTVTEIVADPQRDRLYATDFDNGRLHILDATTGSVERTLAVGSRPSDLSLSADGERLYIALSGGSSIAVLDLESWQLQAPLSLSFSPAYIAAGRQQHFATSILEFWKGFTTYGQLARVADGHEELLPTIGLVQIDVDGERLYVATHRAVHQYDISGPLPVQLAEVAAEGPVLDLHLSADGRRLYAVCTDFFATPEHVISHGLLNSQENFTIDYVEVFSTASMRKVGELYTGAFPRAVTSWGDRVVVAAADSMAGTRLAGFAAVYDAATLQPVATHRLVGTPTSSAAIAPSTGHLYVAVNNPYDIRERFGERQDVQVVPLTGTATAPDLSAEESTLETAAPETPTAPDPETDTAGLGAPFLWTTPAATQHEMVLVPAGAFIMGSDDGDADEQPVHAVELDAYFIDVFAVSVGQYRACTEAGACEPPTSANLCNWFDSVPDDHPINCMYWKDADDYCTWAGLRLPTEAEWEKAARGTDARTYPWGEDFDRDRANYGDGGTMRTTPVYEYPDGISPYGVYDMAGNVWDWVADWYHEHYYADSPQENPSGPESGSLRVLRGGSHWFDAVLMRSANREPYHPDQTDVDIGFRCARSASALPTPARR